MTTSRPLSAAFNKPLSPARQAEWDAVLADPGAVAPIAALALAALDAQMRNSEQLTKAQDDLLSLTQEAATRVLRLAESVAQLPADAPPATEVEKLKRDINGFTGVMRALTRLRDETLACARQDIQLRQDIRDGIAMAQALGNIYQNELIPQAKTDAVKAQLKSRRLDLEHREVTLDAARAKGLMNAQSRSMMLQTIETVIATNTRLFADECLTPLQQMETAAARTAIDVLAQSFRAGSETIVVIRNPLRLR